MTIIAASIEYKRILLIADCRVTLPDGQLHDALQKVYPFGPHAVVAFSGSVGLASSALQEMVRGKGNKSKQKLDTLTRQLSRITDRKARHRCKKGETASGCSYIIAGYAGQTPYLASVTVDGRRDPRIEMTREVGGHSVIGSGESERDACQHAISGSDLEKFSDDQAAFALSGFIDAAMSLSTMSKRFNTGIGDLKMHFVIRPEGWWFVPMHTEMFRGRISDRNKPLGYAPVHSVVYDEPLSRFVLQEHQSGSSYPLASALSRNPYDLRGTVKADFDPYTLRA